MDCLFKRIALLLLLSLTFSAALPAGEWAPGKKKKKALEAAREAQKAKEEAERTLAEKMREAAKREAEEWRDILERKVKKAWEKRTGDKEDEPPPAETETEPTEKNLPTFPTIKRGPQSAPTGEKPEASGDDVEDSMAREAEALLEEARRKRLRRASATARAIIEEHIPDLAGAPPDS